MRNGPVDNRVRFDVDGTVRELTLGPGEEQVLDLSKVPGRAVRAQITSQSGFRPSTMEPGSTDMRYLGCWIELR